MKTLLTRTIALRLCRRRTLVLAPVLILSLLATACPFGSALNFAKAITNILDASDPFVQALPLPASVKAGLVVDFKDLARGGVTMTTEFETCAKSKPCKLTAVDKFSVLFQTVYERGHLGASNAALQRVVGILRGLIASAKIYYGLSTPGITAPQDVTEKDLERQLGDLKAAMSVR